LIFFVSREIRIGDWVTVSGRGNLFPRAQVKELDFLTNTAKVKWEISCGLNVVDISDLKPEQLHHTSRRKSIETNFYHNIQNKTMKQDESVTLMFKRTRFFLVKNLLHMLGLNDANVTLFWKLSTCPLTELRIHMNEEVPKIVINEHGVMNSIEKCLWILRKKFNFVATKKMKSWHFDSLAKTLQNLVLCKFPVVLSVNSTNAAYDHVVVIWQGELIDYESECIYLLNEETLNRVCGHEVLRMNREDLVINQGGWLGFVVG
jgi:hypothetical protein